MDSAPRDGTRIICWHRDRCVVVFWRNGPEYARNRYGRSQQTGNTVWFWSDGYNRFPDVSHWRSCFDPPEGYAAAPRWEPAKTAPELKRPAVEADPADAAEKTWCSQCERRVSAKEIDWCCSPFCKAKAEAA
jgi:hypothetical protein